MVLCKSFSESTTPGAKAIDHINNAVQCIAYGLDAVSLVCNSGVRITGVPGFESFIQKEGRKGITPRSKIWTNLNCVRSCWENQKVDRKGLECALGMVIWCIWIQNQLPFLCLLWCSHPISELLPRLKQATSSFSPLTNSHLSGGTTVIMLVLLLSAAKL